MQVFKSEQVRAAGGVHFLFVCFCKKWIVLIVLLFCFRGGHVWSRLPPGYRRGRQTRQSMQQVGGEGWAFFFQLVSRLADVATIVWFCFVTFLLFSRTRIAEARAFAAEHFQPEQRWSPFQYGFLSNGSRPALREYGKAVEHVVFSATESRAKTRIWFGSRDVATGYMFSRAFRRLHVCPRCMFYRAWNWLHVLPNE